MKKVLLLLFTITCLSAFSQIPQGINYQAIVRNNQGIPILNQQVGFKFKIHIGSVGGSVVYEETHAPTTDAFGGVALVLGQGTVVSGIFANINWSSGVYFNEVMLDPNVGGTNYQTMGNAQLNSVPYALYAQSSGSGAGPTGATGAVGGWGLTGNTGTTYGADFMGTTNTQNLQFRVNSYPSGSVEGFGGFNTSLGYQTISDTASSQSVAVGYQAMSNRGVKGIAIGYKAGYGGSIINSIAIGNSTGNSMSGSSNTLLGNNILTNGGGATENVGIGNYCMSLGNGAFRNVGVGYYCLTKGGAENVAIGYYSLSLNTGQGNTAVGHVALSKNSTADGNTAVGDYCMYENTIGSGNTALGKQALNDNTIGGNNTAIGYSAYGQYNSGSNNTAVGANAASDASGNFCTFLGASSAVNGSGSNSMALGYNTAFSVSNKVIVGNTDITSIGGQVGWSTFSDARIKRNIQNNVPGLAFINQLKPVTYTYDIAAQNKLLGVTDTAEWEGKGDIEKIIFSGFIAQEVDAAAKKLGYNFSGVDNTSNVWALRYAEFVVPLVKSVQEQQAIIETLSKKIAELENLLQNRNGRQ